MADYPTAALQILNLDEIAEVPDPVLMESGPPGVVLGLFGLEPIILDRGKSGHWLPNRVTMHKGC